MSYYISNVRQYDTALIPVIRERHQLFKGRAISKSSKQKEYLAKNLGRRSARDDGVVITVSVIEEVFSLISMPLIKA